MRANEFLTEIEAIPSWQYDGGRTALKDFNNINPSTLKQLPGTSEFAYAVEPLGYMTRLLIVDLKNNPTAAIAILELKNSELPISGKPLEVESITVDENYRGRGLAKALYTIVLTIMKRPLIAGEAQTPGGRRNWISITSMPGVEVKGVLHLSNSTLNVHQLAKGKTTEKHVDNTIDQIMQLGGQYLSKDKYSTYWAFDVVPGKGQLQPHVKNSLSKIYGYDSPTTLVARWVG